MYGLERPSRAVQRECPTLSNRRVENEVVIRMSIRNQLINLQFIEEPTVSTFRSHEVTSHPAYTYTDKVTTVPITEGDGETRSIGTSRSRQVTSHAAYTHTDKASTASITESEGATTSMGTLSFRQMTSDSAYTHMGKETTVPITESDGEPKGIGSSFAILFALVFLPVTTYATCDIILKSHSVLISAHSFLVSLSQ